MWAAVVLVLASTTTEPVQLAGDETWVEPLAPMLRDRIDREVSTVASDALPVSGSWLVMIAPCPNPECLQLTMFDPTGARATERWRNADSHEANSMAVRALAAYLQSVLTQPAALTWTPKPRAPVATANAAVLVTPQRPPTSELNLGVGGGGMTDWGSGGIGGAMQLRLRWRNLESPWWVGAALTTEWYRSVGRPKAGVRRWSVPLGLLVGLHTDLGPTTWTGGVGGAVRVLRLDVDSTSGFERFGAGGCVDMDVAWRLEAFRVGLGMTLFAWARRQVLNQDERTVYRDARFQAFGGLRAAYAW